MTFNPQQPYVFPGTAAAQQPQLNPLSKYFRQPAIYLKLPSGGKFYPKGAVTIPPSGELPVYPMTAMDEITSRTPDALFNGTSLIQIVASCIPDIHEPWAIPSIDLNAILAAIRLASYGHDMEISTTCPACKETSELGIDLRSVLDRIESPNYDDPLVIGDLSFYFGPSSYRQQNDIALKQFESQKIIEMVSTIDMSEEEKIAQMGDAFRKITSITADNIARSIRAVKAPDAMVTDYSQIKEFLDNCPKKIWETIRDHVNALLEKTEIKPFDITCSSCQHEYKQGFTLNMSNFFAAV